MMESAEKRKYNGGDFGVNVGAKVPPATFNEIEDLAKALARLEPEWFDCSCVEGLLNTDETRP